MYRSLWSGVTKLQPMGKNWPSTCFVNTELLLHFYMLETNEKNYIPYNLTAIWNAKFGVHREWLTVAQSNRKQTPEFPHSLLPQSNLLALECKPVIWQAGDCVGCKWFDGIHRNMKKWISSTFLILLHLIMCVQSSLPLFL